MILKKMMAAGLLMMAAGCDDYDNDGVDDDDTVRTPPPRATTPPPGDTDMTTPRDRDTGIVTPPRDNSTLTPPRGTPPTAPPITPPTGTEPGATLSTEDRSFVMEAASGGAFEVQSSQMALNQQLSPHLEEVAQMMVDDHSAANAELRALATRKGITITDTLQPKHQQLLDQLKNLKDQEFGTKYQEIQIKAHEETIALFEKCVQTGKDADIKAFAQKTLPALRKHLDHLKMNAPPAGETGEEPDIPDSPPSR